MEPLHWVACLCLSETLLDLLSDDHSSPRCDCQHGFFLRAMQTAPSESTFQLENKDYGITQCHGRILVMCTRLSIIHLSPRLGSHKDIRSMHIINSKTVNSFISIPSPHFFSKSSWSPDLIPPFPFQETFLEFCLALSLCACAS